MKQLAPHQGPEGLHRAGGKNPAETVSGRVGGPRPGYLGGEGAVWAWGWGYRRIRGIGYLEVRE